MRRSFVLLHRWLGLFTALFLLLAGLTGALIAWDHELDALIAPEFHHAPNDAPALAAPELARRLEAADARIRVTYLPLTVEPGDSLSVFVQPRLDARTNQPYEIDFDEVSLDPRNGEVLARRRWGAFSLARVNLMPFLYRLHYSLHLGDIGGVDAGMMLMGIVAIVWMLDAFVALYISFPSRKVWRKSFAFRLRDGGHKMTFDLHRSSGVWLWPVLLVFALTAVSMNLADQVVKPAVRLFSDLTPAPFEAPSDAEKAKREPAIDRERALAIATELGRQRGFVDPAGSMFYAAPWGFYAVSFHRPGMAHGDGGLGNPRLAIDAQTGALIQAQLPGEGTAGDVFMQLQFPLHSGRILGTTGRALVSVLGVVIAMLSFTGVWLWAKKRIARARAESRAKVIASEPVSQPGE